MSFCMHTSDVTCNYCNKVHLNNPLTATTSIHTLIPNCDPLMNSILIPIISAKEAQQLMKDSDIKHKLEQKNKIFNSIREEATRGFKAVLFDLTLVEPFKDELLDLGYKLNSIPFNKNIVEVSWEE